MSWHLGDVVSINIIWSFCLDHKDFFKFPNQQAERFGERKKCGWRCSLSALFTEQVPKIQIRHHFVFAPAGMTPAVCVKTQIV